MRVFAFLFGVLHCLSLCWCLCQYPFLDQPGTVSGSPITCNMLGARVEIKCRVETTESAMIVWFFTADVTQAGKSDNTQLDANNPDYLFQTQRTRDDVSDNLVIRSYDRSYAGFYWCSLGAVSSGLPGSFSVSQVVQLFTTFTVAELDTCSNPVILVAGGEGRCAFGDPESSLSIVAGVVSTNVTIISTTAPPVETTTEVTTEVELEADTTTLNTTMDDEDYDLDNNKDDVAPTENILRTILIWSGVAAGALVFLVIGFIIFVVVCAQCG